MWFGKLLNQQGEKTIIDYGCEHHYYRQHLFLQSKNCLRNMTYKVKIVQLTAIRPCLGQREILQACWRSICCPMAYLNIRGREGREFDKIQQNMTFILKATIIWFLAPQLTFRACLKIAEGLGTKRKYLYVALSLKHIYAGVNVSL